MNNPISLTDDEIERLSWDERILDINTQKMLAMAREPRQTSSAAIPMVVSDDDDDNSAVTLTSQKKASTSTQTAKPKTKRSSVSVQDPWNPAKSFYKLKPYMMKTYPIDWDKVTLKPANFRPLMPVTTSLVNSSRRYTCMGMLPYVLGVFGQDSSSEWPDWVKQAVEQITAKAHKDKVGAGKKPKEPKEAKAVKAVKAPRKKAEPKKHPKPTVVDKVKKIIKKRNTKIDKVKAKMILDEEQVVLDNGVVATFHTSIAGVPARQRAVGPSSWFLEGDRTKHLPTGGAREKAEAMKKAREDLYVLNQGIQMFMAGIVDLMEKNPKSKRSGVVIPKWMVDQLNMDELHWSMRALGRRGVKGLEFVYKGEDTLVKWSGKFRS